MKGRLHLQLRRAMQVLLHKQCGLSCLPWFQTIGLWGGSMMQIHGLLPSHLR